METTYARAEKAGLGTFLLAVPGSTLLSVIIMWICGGYNGIITQRPAFLAHDAVLFTLDVVARLIFGFALFLVLRQSIYTGANPMARKASVILWTVTYIMSIMFLPVFFALKWYAFAFIWLILMLGVTTANFIVNFKVTLGGALAVLPYWAFMIYLIIASMMIM